MATNATGLMEKLKGTAVKVGIQGVRYVVDGTVAAVKAMDRLQEMLPKQQREVRVTREPAMGTAPDLERPIPAQPVEGGLSEEEQAQARSTAELVLEEARAAEERIKQAPSARRPLKVSIEEPQEEPKRQARKTTRTQGRKTTATATAPKRATAQPEGFKAKRGQKHKH